MISTLFLNQLFITHIILYPELYININLFTFFGFLKYYLFYDYTEFILKFITHIWIHSYINSHIYLGLNIKMVHMRFLDFTRL